MTTRTIAVCWVDDEKEAHLRAPNGAVVADVWVGRHGGWLWETFDASGVDCASREEAKAAAEASLGAVAPPTAAPAIPLRWEIDKDDWAHLMLGARLVANVRPLPDDETDGTCWAGAMFGLLHETDSCATREEGMRAVEAAFGIASPLPVEGEDDR